MTHRELYVLRHGKSDWHTDQRDHDRPLEKRGIEAARTVGRLLRATGAVPGRVLASSAVRAHTTAQLAAEAGDFGCPVEIDGRLYEATTDRWLEVVSETDDAVERLLVAGHQPTCSQVIARLTGARVDFPTAALARLEIGSDWSELETGSAHLAWLVTPRTIQAAIRDAGGDP